MAALSRQQIKTLYDQAVAMMRAGQIAPAAQAFRQLLTVLPDHPEIHANLSEIAHKLGQQQTRADHLARALAARPDDPRLNEAATEAFTATGDYPAALAAHDRLIAQDRGNLKRQADKAVTLQNIGDFDAANALFRKLIKKHPKTGALYRMFMTTARIDADDPVMTGMDRALHDPKLPTSDRMHIHFARARALEQQKRTGEVFADLHKANALQLELYPKDSAEKEAQNAALHAFQDGADLTPIGPEQPVRSLFVTGMPRSGTTLVEQILASHSDVTAGGEMPYASRLTVSLFGRKSGFIPMDEAADQQIFDFAKGYVQAIRMQTGATSGAVTDKAIQAHRIYGLLHRALRGVRFIVVHRDPRDIALSIYKNHFRLGTHRYANDLAEIAAEIKSFRANIAMWKTRLPAGALYEVRYEDLVTDPDPQIRALIDAADLPWEDRCLDFHTAKSTVKTLSLQQVRQPIYTGSAQAWKRYEADLAPFIDAWGDTPWD